MEHSINVFLSHSWKDKLVVEKISEGLGEFCNVWMDYRRLKPGDEIQSSIDPEIASADLILLIWSSNSAESANVDNEIKTALRNKKRIIPCFIEYDSKSVATPQLPDQLKHYLGIDFHHFMTGLVRLTSYILERNWGHDPEFRNDPRTKLIQELDGLMDYLSNYHKLNDVDASRIEWIKQIIKSFDDYIDAGGDPTTLEPLLQAALVFEKNDPEGIGLLIAKLKTILYPDSDHLIKVSQNNKSKKKIKTKTKSNKSSKKSKDILKNLIKSHFPKGQRKQIGQSLDNYVEIAPFVLNAMQMYCVGVNSIAGCEVVSFLKTYLDNSEDLIPDYHGNYGLLDDAWLINNTAYRLIESNILPNNLVLIDWNQIIFADQIATRLMPGAVVQQLDGYVKRMFGLIVAEVQLYQPQFGQANMSGGNTYADRWYDAGVESLQNM